MSRLIPLSFAVIFAVQAQTSPALNEYFERAAALEKAEKLGEAEKVYKEALRAFPDHPEIEKRLAIVYQTELRFPESIEILENILRRAPAYPQAGFYLGLSYFGLNRYEAAAAALEKALQADRQDRRARYYLSMVYQAQGRNLDAIRQLEDLLADHPGDARALYQLARLYKAGAVSTIDRLAKAAPDSTLLIALRAQSRFENEQYAEAIKDYLEIRRRDPEFAGLRLALGQSYWRTQQIPEAEREFQGALDEDPNHPLATYYMAEILVKKEQHREAIALLERSIAGDPTSMPAYALFAKCQAALGNVDAAIELLRKAVELAPREKALHYQLARLYARKGDDAANRRELDIVQKLTAEEKESLLKSSTAR
jgi:tetratricopeptide (TPR) repeat protein